ncbi:hypothetical protein [Roseovarius sp. MMSF_3350]|uniref:hypothetical protein n=1 Tax=Roseovarius sp. MMSF_3350 TaxID=3046706 RepID=UPI00273F8973|nr:hypothetical protein [Roseovarius sp. MMSF_3350]
MPHDQRLTDPEQWLQKAECLLKSYEHDVFQKKVSPEAYEVIRALSAALTALDLEKIEIVCGFLQHHPTLKGTAMARRAGEISKAITEMEGK